MNFYYSQDAQSQNRYVLLIIGALAIIVCIIGIIYQFNDFSAISLLSITLLMIMGIYNFTLGIRLFSKTPVSRSFVLVDKNGVFFKREMKKLVSYHWDEIDKISVRRSGVYIGVNGETTKVSYDMLPYHKVKEFQTTIKELGEKENIPVTLEMDVKFETS